MGSGCGTTHPKIPTSDLKVWFPPSFLGQIHEEYKEIPMAKSIAMAVPFGWVHPPGVDGLAFFH
jgi:hypothetical protein